MIRMRKQIATLALAGTLVGATVVGGTLAYFTDSEEQQNVVTMGRIDISLQDELSEKNGGMVDKIVPNQTIQDAVSVSNKGKNDAFVRLAVDYSQSDISGEDILKTFVWKEMQGGTTEALWTAVEDAENGVCYYYYDGILKTGETVNFLDSLHIPAEWGNDYADKSIVLNITAEAIQSDFLEDASGNAITDAQTAFANVAIE